MGLAIKLAFANPRLAIELLMVAAILIGGYLYNKKTAELAEAKTQFGALAEDLKSQITIKDGQIQVLNRRKDGKVETQTVYVPGEGTVTVITTTVTVHGPAVKPPGTAIDLGDGTIIYVKDRGFTFKPGFGLDFDAVKLRPYLDAKLIYFKRYSASVGGTPAGVGITVSRHLDDILYFRPRNVELFLHYRVLRRSDATPVSIGIRSNF
jgi:hypothetical protein